MKTSVSRNSDMNRSIETFHLRCAKPSLSYTCNFVFSMEAVSTCRGSDRQSHHPHISIQLEVRGQDELNTCLQTSQRVWMLFLLFWVQNREKKNLPIWHASPKCGEHLSDVLESRMKFPGSQTLTQYMDSWTHEMGVK